MTPLIYIQIAFMLYIIVQAYYNYFCIDIMKKAPTIDLKTQSNWHLFQALSYVIICLLVSYLYPATWQKQVALYLLLNLLRQMLFNPILNGLRGKAIFYLSDRGQDKMLKKIFGEAAALVVSVLSIAVIILLNIYIKK